MTALRVAVACLLLILVFFAGSYLSGMILFLRLDLPLSKLGPWDFVRYWTTFGQAASYRATVLSSGLAGFAVPVLAALALALKLLLSHKPHLYGEARFATMGDLRSRNMLKADETALVVGRKDGKYLYFNGQQFVILAAPTRSGKGVGIVVPNLLSYQHSVVVLDIKQENFDLTSGFRAKYGQDVFLFNPFAEDLRTHRWNPLGYVSADPNFRVSDVQSIAAMLYPASDLHKDPFWANQAQNAFVAFALYAFEQAAYMAEHFDVPETELAPTMGGLYRLTSGRPGQDIKAYLSDLAAWPHLSSSARTAFSTLLGQANETLASIMGTFKEPLNPWLNPVVDAATSANDFDLREVRRKRMTVYVAIQPSKLAESRLILNLFFSQLINLNTKDLPQSDPSLKYQCLLLMDEFTSIGRMDIVSSSVSFMAGYNLRLMPIVQSLSQLEATYGKEHARTIMTNHALRVIFAPREQQDANEYSEMLGYTGVRKDSISRSRSRESSYTRSESEERRALMLPQELKAMGDDRQILIVEGMAHPVMSDKIRYYKDPAFQQRLLPKVDVPVLELPVRRLALPVEPSVEAPQRHGPPDSVMSMDAREFLHSHGEASGPPRAERAGEYTGLAGVAQEIDKVMDALGHP
ncbi:type IV secretory system conjugative DNA transfer family protein [Hydrogenophaga sp. PAMC20947]|uniref:type IV secretory system conjugative DNA transfer family protein n=1 Tax=Hydrogenophaga sp. PAMC20947 TaxID=2565558 RepID=UPI00109E0A4F|nr:type IV secretory system conjugative DNA transfer family protein [Hydrogenophaga sp. PAMC20947]QCB45512.1 type IV secretory system conjugative DNA transfer family protein [Hydrogenophaga sp. PAMC20947]